MSKINIYSVLPRLFGNNNNTNKKNGTLEENGSGKMSDFDSSTLRAIKNMGFTHIWFIGIIEHSTKSDFSKYGIKPDFKCIVKGEAGSPYAIKDYYDVSPSIADDVENRIDEFKELIKRVHDEGLKIIIDFVPNHISRSYTSDKKPKGINDFGENDDVSKGFYNQNDFYYIIGEELKLPISTDENYKEIPAKATGNDLFSAYPSINDWYETIKLNYGKGYELSNDIFEPIPSTWRKMFHILKYWISIGVDGFRCDMAQMVPVEFWKWILPKIKTNNNNREILFIAEIYQKELYRDFINAGFDILYDKVGVYDTLRSIIKGESYAYNFNNVREETADITDHMCYFLENHDEQRIASEFFSGCAQKAIPAMAIVLLSGNNPYLHYFGQEVGEMGMDCEGFSGLDGRTTIFDYWHIDSVSKLRRGSFSDKFLNSKQASILKSYKDLLSLSRKINHIHYYAIEKENLIIDGELSKKVFAFIRYTDNKELVLIISSFEESEKKIYINISSNFQKILGINNNDVYSWYDINNKNEQQENKFICLNQYAPIYCNIDKLSFTIIKLTKH